MKKQITYEADICDICDKDHSHHKCIGCGKDICYDCSKNPENAIGYRHTIHAGYNAVIICADCDAKFRADDKDEMFKAIQTVKNLTVENETWWQDFKARAEHAEAKLKKLMEKRGIKL